MPSIRRVRWAMGGSARLELSFYASFASASTGSFLISRGGSETTINAAGFYTGSIGSTMTGTEGSTAFTRS